MIWRYPFRRVKFNSRTWTLTRTFNCIFIVKRVWGAPKKSFLICSSKDPQISTEFVMWRLLKSWRSAPSQTSRHIMCTFHSITLQWGLFFNWIIIMCFNAHALISFTLVVLESHYCFVLLTFLFSAHQMWMNEWLSDSCRAWSPAEEQENIWNMQEPSRSTPLYPLLIIDCLSPNKRFLFWIYRGINTNSNKKQDLMSLTSLWELFICGVIHRHLAISKLSCKMV